MKNTAEVLQTLPHFIGSESFMVYPLNRAVLITEGVRYVADSCEAWWFLDKCVTTGFEFIQKKRDAFIDIQLDVSPDKTAQIAYKTGNGKLLFVENLEFTDFPLAKINLWLIGDAKQSTLLLPSEY